MKAYAIFDGGGVKGAAFAGCLKAAKERHIEFLGYGGSSAGSIIALLAYAGYEGYEIENIMVNEIDFKVFLDDKGVNLSRLSILKPPIEISKLQVAKWLYKLYKEREFIGSFVEKLGLYDGRELKNFLAQKVWARFPELKDNYEFTFSELRKLKEEKHGVSIPLKVVASDLNTYAPVVYSDGSNGKDKDASVLSAVRASMSYPFVFRPVPMFDKYMVDGGLCINLPIHIFEQERIQNRQPIIAFDLISIKSPIQATYTIDKYIEDMFETALGSSEYLLHSAIPGVYHIQIKIPSHINTMDFSLSKPDKESLSNLGYFSTNSFFQNRAPQLEKASNIVERLQAQHTPPRLIEPVLEAIAFNFQQNTKAEKIRCGIMLPIDNTDKINVYHYNMRYDPDIDLVLPIEAGCSGRAWKGREPVFADLEEAQEDFASWGLNQQQQNKIPKTKKAMLSIPIMDFSSGYGKNIEEIPIIGVLSIDTETNLANTEWIDTSNKWVVVKIKEWADILSKILV